MHSDKKIRIANQTFAGTNGFALNYAYFYATMPEPCPEHIACACMCVY